MIWATPFTDPTSSSKEPWQSLHFNECNYILLKKKYESLQLTNTHSV